MNETMNVERVAGLRRFKPYLAYKDSGVEWLGDVPARWTVRARFLLNGAPRATEWTGAYDTMGGPVAPWWFRRGKGVPALAMVPMSPVPFFPIVETPGANGEECPDR